MNSKYIQALTRRSDIVAADIESWYQRVVERVERRSSIHKGFLLFVTLISAVAHYVVFRLWYALGGNRSITDVFPNGHEKRAGQSNGEKRNGEKRNGVKHK